MHHSNAGKQALFLAGRMTAAARVEIDIERLLSVVAGSTKLPLANGIHGDLAGPKLHLEQAVMASVTTVLYSVYPVRKYRGWYGLDVRLGVRAW